MTNAVVDVHNLEKTYGKAGERPYTALKGLNFSVATGEFVGIMGASGSGKTTLLNSRTTGTRKRMLWMDVACAQRAALG